MDGREGKIEPTAEVAYILTVVVWQWVKLYPIYTANTSSTKLWSYVTLAMLTVFMSSWRLPTN